MQDDGELHTFGLLEQVRNECKDLWGVSSDAYFRVDEMLRELANPNLHDIPTNLPFRVELWDRNGQHIRWVIAASSSVTIGHAALDVRRCHHRSSPRAPDIAQSSTPHPRARSKERRWIGPGAPSPGNRWRKRRTTQRTLFLNWAVFAKGSSNI
jgi:hypothetical protein